MDKDPMTETEAKASKNALNGLRYLLSGERRIEDAEETLHEWAMALAEAGRDREASEALRLEGALLGFRCEFLSTEKAP